MGRVCDRERGALETQFRAGKLTWSELDKAPKELENRHQEMWDQFDGSYQLPE